MPEPSSSEERQRNVWAPWRLEYIHQLAEGADGCFLCRYRDDREHDEKNLLLWRGRRSLMVLNRFPYTGGHSLVAPFEHVANLSDLDGETLCEMMEMLADAQQVLAHALRAEGFNVGMNIGRCAGAGLPGHLHVHIVPRWSGDTNFMSVFGGTRVISAALDELYRQLRQAGEELRLPRAARPEAP